jgi:[ribosomal protein S5]-alanine N-acetyltransferase
LSFIETDRLLLRSWLPADVEPLAAIYGDPEVVAMLPFGVRDVPQTRDIIARMTADYEREGIALWPVVLKSTGELIGSCGLMGTRGGSVAEIGFAFARAFWGKGFAHEAAQATIEFGRGSLHMREIFALVRFENQRCVALMHRLGMRFDRVVRAKRADLLRYVTP